MKPTILKHKIGNSNKKSTDEEDNGNIPGFQNLDRGDSSSDNVSEYNQGDDDSSINTSRNNKEYLLDENNDRED